MCVYNTATAGQQHHIVLTILISRPPETVITGQILSTGEDGYFLMTNWVFTRYDRQTDRSVRRSYRVNAQ